MTNWLTKKRTSWQAQSLTFFLIFASAPIANYFFFDRHSPEGDLRALLMQLGVVLVLSLIAGPAVAAANRRFTKPVASQSPDAGVDR